MKKLKLICSAIAAFGVLALAGCDLEVPDSSKVKYASTDYDVSELPAVVAERIVFKDSKLPALKDSQKDSKTWTVNDGVSLSVFVDSDYSSDYSMLFQTTYLNFAPTFIHVLTSTGSKAWEANKWIGYEWKNKAAYLTLSINATDKTITVYRDGKLIGTYSEGASGDNGLPSGRINAVLNDISENGIYCIHPTDSWANDGAGNYTMKYFVVDAAVDADGATAKYNAYKTWASAQ